MNINTLGGLLSKHGQDWEEVTAMLPPIKAAAPPPPAGGFRICGGSDRLEIEAAASSDGKSLKKFSIVGYTGGQIRLSGWYYPVVVDLSGMQIPSQSIPALYRHDHSVIVGHTNTIDKTQQRLKLTGVFSNYNPVATPTDSEGQKAAREIIDLAANNFIWQASIGAQPISVNFIDEGESAKVNGKNFSGPFYHVTESVLAEISFVSIGADMATSASVAAGAKLTGSITMPFDQWLQAKGIDPATVTESIRKVLQAQYDSENRTQNPPPPPGNQGGSSGGSGTANSGATSTGTTLVNASNTTTPGVSATSFEQRMAAIEAENTRIEYIRERTTQVAETYLGDASKISSLRELSAAAIADKSQTQTNYDLALARFDRAAAPTFFVQKEKAVTQDVLEAAVCMHLKTPTLEKDFKEQTLELAHSRFKGGVSLQDLLTMAAQRGGWRGHSIKADLRNALRCAFREQDDNGYGGRQIRAEGPSTYSISTILSNVANKYLTLGYNSVEMAWKMIAAIGSVNDYKEITNVALTGDMVYKKVARGGEVKHGTVSEIAHGNKADVYGLILGIDQQDIVNDDLGALTRVSQRVGRGGALTINQVFWAAWLDDSTFFPTDKSNANYDDGATDSVLTSVGIANADAVFAAQTDPDGQPLALTPRILLVPKGLEASALSLMASEMLIGASGTVTAATNVFRGRYKVVSSVYLTNPLAWYLLADPNDMPAIEVVFLNGVETPNVQTADQDIDRMGITIRGTHSFGVRKQEFRAALKMKGAA